ncbi:MAG: transposase family protein [Proteobacteria bacterium]|nr:transposase family protein [Pseudomonadota bacterium]
MIRVLDSSPWSAGDKRTICGSCGTAHRSRYDRRHRRVRDLSCADYRIYPELEVRRIDCQRCDTVKVDDQTTSGVHAAGGVSRTPCRFHPRILSPQAVPPYRHPQ